MIGISSILIMHMKNRDDSGRPTVPFMRAGRPENWYSFMFIDDARNGFFTGGLWVFPCHKFNNQKTSDSFHDFFPIPLRRLLLRNCLHTDPTR